LDDTLTALGQPLVTAALKVSLSLLSDYVPFILVTSNQLN